MMHDLAGYTPFAGRKLRGWPVTVLSRGRVIVADGKRSVEAGSGPLPAAHGRRGGETDRAPDAGHGSRAEFWRDAAVIRPPRCVRIER